MPPVPSALEPVHQRVAPSPGASSTLAEDVRNGLTQRAKELPPKHLYDARGSELFERITQLPEYYPTRTERAILERHAGDIAAWTRAGELVELGAGSATKSRILLDAMRREGALCRYVPFDVCADPMLASAGALAREYPGLVVHAVLGDFERHLDRLPAPPAGAPRIVALLGGTLGNLPPTGRRRLLRRLAQLLRPQDHLLLGVDVVKDVRVVEAAYDDPAGVTAEFNRNVLHVINRELDADFDVCAFEHVARFDPVHEWIEMRLRASRACRVRIAALDLEVAFEQGEELRTEISAKFTRTRLERDHRAAGLRLRRWLMDPQRMYAVILAGR